MTTETESVAALALQGAGSTVVTTADGRELLILAEGFTKMDITDPRGMIHGRPSRIKQAVTLQTVDSLVDYVNRFKTDETMLFADIGRNSIGALIDYHGPTEAANVDHSATMVLPYSEEWKAWTAASGQLVRQLEFARFIEENAADIAAPSGADLLEVVRDLQAVRRANFKKAVRTASGNENFEYSEETTASTKNGSVEIPAQFKLELPVYFGGAPTPLFAFLRWKLSDGDLTIGVTLHRAEHVRQAVFRGIVLDAAERTARPALFGRVG